MDQQFCLRIVIENPFPGVEYGLQKGSGNKYETIQKQKGNGTDLVFEFSTKLKFDQGDNPVLSGPFVQGPVHERFVYIDIGTYAGQENSLWSRRLKIPLTGISKVLIEQAPVLIAKVAGIGKDGGPNCATVKPFDGWRAGS